MGGIEKDQRCFVEKNSYHKTSDRPKVINTERKD